ncbi:MAG TPA: 5'-3' exonuclease H3TH domain-containing protein [Gemmatimonadales bacterium]|nr:5'-3' exonuclease H3TH domain-containing protein [Gemmatimonadales bacterium]
MVDGTYELFRAHFGAPPQTSPAGVEVGATLGLMRSLLSLLREDGVTHVGCAFDHVIESFRNELYADYKTSEGVPEELLAQFPLAERAVRALGIVVWPMVEFEADDALATAAARAAELNDVAQVVICSPDKDLAQCVRGARVVCLDRRRRLVYDEPGVIQKFGVAPTSIPDWLALVGDAADGYPGVPRWGERSATTLLARYRHLEDIPDDAARWDVTVRGAAGLAQSLREHRDAVLLYRRLATLRSDVPLVEQPDALSWNGAHGADLAALCEELGDDQIVDRIPQPHRSDL